MAIYLQDPDSGKVMLAKNASAPSGHNNIGQRGRTYDWRTHTVYIGKTECSVWCDHRWGKRLYIHYDDKWYTVAIDHETDTFGGIPTNAEYPHNFDIIVKRAYPRATKLDFTVTGNRLEIDVTPGHLVQVSKAEYDAFKTRIHPNSLP